MPKEGPPSSTIVNKKPTKSGSLPGASPTPQLVQNVIVEPAQPPPLPPTTIQIPIKAEPLAQPQPVIATPIQVVQDLKPVQSAATIMHQLQPAATTNLISSNPGGSVVATHSSKERLMPQPTGKCLSKWACSLLLLLPGLLACFALGCG